MDYISKPALMGKLTSSEEQQKIKAMSGADAYNEFLMLVNGTEKADVAPVRHARWIPEEDGDVYFTCSYCGCEISTSWDYDDLEWNFCPECGREMTSGAQPQREDV